LKKNNIMMKHIIIASLVLMIVACGNDKKAVSLEDGKSTTSSVSFSTREDTKANKPLKPKEANRNYYAELGKSIGLSPKEVNEIRRIRANSAAVLKELRGKKDKVSLNKRVSINEKREADFLALIGKVRYQKKVNFDKKFWN